MATSQQETCASVATKAEALRLMRLGYTHVNVHNKYPSKLCTTILRIPAQRGYGVEDIHEHTLLIGYFTPMVYS